MVVVDLVTGLAQNIALLLALTMLYGVLRPSLADRPPWLHAPLAGVLFGLIAIAGMHTPIVVAPGVIADARVIPVLLAGPFAGAGAAILAGLIGGAYRFVLGGRFLHEQNVSTYVLRSADPRSTSGSADR